MIMYYDSVQLELLKISEAHNKVKLKHMRDSFMVGIHCYSDQVDRIVDFIFDSLKKGNYLTHEALDAAKVYLELSSNILESVEMQSINIQKEIMKKEFISKKQDLKYIQKLSFGDLKQFQNNFFDELMINQFFAGNVLETQALSLGNKVVKLLNAKKEADAKEFYQESLIKLPANKVYIYRDLNQLIDDKNNSILDLYQIITEDPNKEKAMLIYLDNLI